MKYLNIVLVNLLTMELQYIYSKVLDLDEDNKYTIELTKGKEVENVKISKASKYLLTNLKISPKIEEDIQKWKDYERIKNIQILF